MSTEQKVSSSVSLGIIVGLFTGVMVFTGVAWLLWQIPFPYELSSFREHHRYWIALFLNDLFSPLLRGTADEYRQHLHQLSPAGIATSIHVRFYFAAFVGLGVGLYLGYLAGKGQPAERHVKGRQLKEGSVATSAIIKQSKAEAKSSGDGLKFHPRFNWRMPLGRESRHFLAIGATGSGKTTILTPMMEAAIKRGDQLIVYDNKGDFTEWIETPVLLAPWDARSHALDIAKDCRNIQQAREFAARLIPESTDPIWHQAARLILTALIIKLQVEKPEQWTWKDLYRLVCLSQQDLLKILKMYTPEASNILEAPGKTSQSVLFYLSANAWLIGDLAKAWGDAPPNKRFSITSWIKGAHPGQKVVILQGSANYQLLSNAYIQLVFDLATGLVNSPEISKSNNRRIWVFLDEFPQLGKLERFRPFLEVGRSKGMRVVLACQDISQIREIYGQDAANSWLGLVGTQIITRLGAGETANFVAEKMVGYKTIDRIVMNGGERSAPVRERELVVDPSELSDKLGADSKGVKALILGWKDALIIDWPYSNPLKIRESSVLAPWLFHQSTKVDSNDQSKPIKPAGNPRIKLRKPTAEQLKEMALSGTDVLVAGEDLSDMSRTAVGELHESH